MPEKQYTTNNISKIADNTAPFLTAGFLNEGNTYPYSIPELTAITGVSIQNSNATTALTLDVTLSDETSYSIPVNANGTYTGHFEYAITSIDCDGTDFAIELLKRSA